MTKLVIVTANIGQFDNIREDHYRQTNCRFVMFTDDKDAKSSLWELIQIRRKFVDPRQESRMYKWLFHKYLPDVEYSLWVDADVSIKIDINELIGKYLKNADIAIYPHRARNCIYKEAEKCIELKLDYVNVIKKQIEEYRLENYPDNNGLHESHIMLRRHTEEIKRFNEAVWANICSGSLRDQLSLNYIAWKLGIKINNLPNSEQANSFHRLGHNRDRDKYVDF